jgi:hypothetical protein
MSTFVSFNHQVMPIETCEFQFKKKKTQKNQLPAQLTIVKGRQLFGQLPIEKEKIKNSIFFPIGRRGNFHIFAGWGVRSI